MSLAEILPGKWRKLMEFDEREFKRILDGQEFKKAMVGHEELAQRMRAAFESMSIAVEFKEDGTATCSFEVEGKAPNAERITGFEWKVLAEDANRLEVVINPSSARMLVFAFDGPDCFTVSFVIDDDSVPMFRGKNRFTFERAREFSPPWVFNRVKDEKN